MTTRSHRLAKHIQRTVTGPMWHGAALGPLLEGMTEAQASARPISGAHTIWEIARMVGIPNPRVFARSFHKIVECSASQFRSKNTPIAARKATRG